MLSEEYKLFVKVLECECDKYNAKTKIENRKEYNHKYYLEITKPKRKAKKE